MIARAAALALAGAVALAPTASADIDTYFNELRRNGLQVANATAAVNTGIWICQQLGSGRTGVSVASQLYREIDWASTRDAAVIVVAAVTGLCPEHSYMLSGAQRKVV